MPKPPHDFLIDSFIYKEYEKSNGGWTGESNYKEPVKISLSRIDRGAKYSSSASGKQLLYNAVVFCYGGMTTPLPEFKTQSILHFDGIDHTVTKVIPIYEAYSKTIYSYELEVV